MAKKRGRPPKKRGNATSIVNDLEPTRCPKCKSTERSEYNQTRSVDGPVRIDGIVYRRIEFRRTKCLGCGQHRVDRTRFPLESPDAGQ